MHGPFLENDAAWHCAHCCWKQGCLVKQQKKRQLQHMLCKNLACHLDAPGYISLFSTISWQSIPRMTKPKDVNVQNVH